MSRTRARPAAPQARIIALDVGTTMTRFCVVGAGEVVSHPTVLLTDRAGRAVATGWNAWHMTLDKPRRLRSPVAGGVVVDVTGCANMLRLLLAEEGLSRIDGVALTIPAVANRIDTMMLASAVRAATGAPILVMRPAVAAAAARDGVDAQTRTGLLCDVGASVIEVGAFHRQRLRAQAGTQVDTHAYIDEPAVAVGELLRLIHTVLGRLREADTDQLIAAPVTLIGGAQQSRPLLELIYTAVHLDIELAHEPESAAVSGLARRVRATVHRAQ
jgi:hypothetical protein